MPSNLPDNGMATLPPIPNIENLMDLDINQPGPGPGPRPNPSNPPNPGSFTPNTQLKRDIAGIRQAVQSQSFRDEMNRSLIPDWNLTTDNPDDKIENGEIPNWVYVALASAILIAAISIKKPEWGTAILNGLRTIWTCNEIFR